MDPADFAPDHRPNCRLQPGGYVAFLPPPLPPPLAIDWKLATHMSEADRRLPN